MQVMKSGLRCGRDLETICRQNSWAAVKLALGTFSCTWPNLIHRKHSQILKVKTQGLTILWALRVRSQIFSTAWGRARHIYPLCLVAFSKVLPIKHFSFLVPSRNKDFQSRQSRLSGFPLLDPMPQIVSLLTWCPVSILSWQFSENL